MGTTASLYGYRWACVTPCTTQTSDNSSREGRGPRAVTTERDSCLSVGGGGVYVLKRVKAELEQHIYMWWKGSRACTANVYDVVDFHVGQHVNEEAAMRAHTPHAWAGTRKHTKE